MLTINQYDLKLIPSYMKYKSYSGLTHYYGVVKAMRNNKQVYRINMEICRLYPKDAIEDARWHINHW